MVDHLGHTTLLLRLCIVVTSLLLFSMLALLPVQSLYLDRMVQQKKVEVDRLLRLHQSPDDPLVMRMSYVASECRYNVTKALKLLTDKEKLHQMSVIIDMKRRSPTIPEKRNIVEFGSAGKFSELLTLAGADGFLINTNELEYGGRPEELKECSKAIRKCKPSLTPAIIHKDLIIHPVQIAQALEDGASGVLLIVAVVGGDLETLLDACTIMGTEALVEVHTINELEFALNKGATTFLVNMWDRTTGKLFSEQARGVASMLPINSLAIAAGNINDMEQVAELGFYGYDGVVLGRGILDVPDVKGFIEEVHSFRGVPRDRGMGMGMKGLPF